MAIEALQIHCHSSKFHWLPFCSMRLYNGGVLTRTDSKFLNEKSIRGNDYSSFYFHLLGPREEYAFLCRTFIGLMFNHANRERFLIGITSGFSLMHSSVFRYIQVHCDEWRLIASLE